jgi:3-isopropylmalate/(R)-2-methylmalate dehydratase small subunit
MSFDLNRPIKGKVWKFGDSIDTDCINPFYRFQNDPEQIRKHTMDSARPEFPEQVKPGDIVVAGRNFGCGSARNGKVLYEVGVVAVLAESFSTLFLRNCISGGDLVLAVPGISSFVEDGATLEIDYRNGVIRNPATGKTLPVKKYPPMIEQLFNTGGILSYTKTRYDTEAART